MRVPIPQQILLGYSLRSARPQNISLRRESSRILKSGCHGRSFSSQTEDPANKDLLAALFPENYGRPSDEVHTKRRQERLRARHAALQSRVRGTNIAETDELATPAFTEKGILLLKAASKNLAREDFTRLSPKAKRMQGWDMRLGHITKIIPGRNLDTLEREEHYYLVFDSGDSAREYRDRAIKIAHLNNLHGSSSFNIRKATPPHLLFEGEDSRELTRKYTLTPSGQRLDLSLVKTPLTLGMRDLLQYDGYPAIVDRPDKSPAEVVIRTNHAIVTVRGLRSVLSKAEKDRSMPWTKSGFETVKISSWTPPHGKNARDLQTELVRQQQGRYTGLQSEGGKSVSEGGDVVRDADDAPLAIDIDDLDGAQPVGAETAEQSAKSSIFIVGVQTEFEADRIASYWHRRRLPLRRTAKNSHSADSYIDFRAEVLW